LAKAAKKDRKIAIGGNIKNGRWKQGGREKIET
jgi:hypothetical protein